MATSNVMSTVKAIEIVKEKKKIDRIKSWSSEQEQILKIWGEKAAGHRWLHYHASRHYKRINSRLSFANIILTTLSGFGGMGAANMQSITFSYFFASLNVLSAFLASLQKFYMSAEKSETHSSLARQFATFYRHISVELMLAPSARTPATELSKNCRMEYDRMLQIAPPIPHCSVMAFRAKFPDARNCPEIANGLTEIAVYETPSAQTPPTSPSPRRKRRFSMGQKLWRLLSPDPPPV